MLRRDAIATVLHGEHDAAVGAAFETDIDAAIDRRVADRVGDEVREGAVQFAG